MLRRVSAWRATRSAASGDGLCSMVLQGCVLLSDDQDLIIRILQNGQHKQDTAY
jgi:hypothetical protein